MAQPLDEQEKGRIAGWGAGMVAGAQIGTAAIPIPVVGTLTGALVGGLLGSKLGQRIAPALISTFNQLTAPPPASEPEFVHSIPRNAIPVVESTPDEIELEGVPHTATHDAQTSTSPANQP